MKAGTTTLFEHLRAHPQVCASHKKEPNFFLDGNVHNLENYDSLFDFNPNLHKIKIEASTAYSKYPRHTNVAENIAKLNLNPKFIYIVRHPIDRINSEINFWKNFPEWSDPKSTVNFNKMIECSKYYLQLSKYENTFDRNQILLVDFHELKSDPQKVFDEICQFLEISKQLLKERDKVDNKTEKRSNLELKLLKKLPKTMHLFPNSWKSKAKIWIRSYSKISNFELTPDEEKIAREKLKKDMAQFNKHYHFDIGKWGF